MEKLPNEIMEMIFQRLDINSLVRSRRVCKKWLRLIAVTRIREIAIASNFSNVGNYFYTNKPVKQSNLLTLKKIPSFRQNQKFAKSLMAKVQCLYIQMETKGARFNLYSLNELCPNLIQLEIGCLRTAGFCLRLDKVEILTILEGPRAYTRLQTPALTKFKTRLSLNNFGFESPEKITHLSLAGYHAESVRKFTNLEHLHCRYAMTLSGNDILKQHPSLKVLHTEDMQRTALTDLLKQIKVERKLDFTLIYGDMKIESLDDVERFTDQLGRLHGRSALTMYPEERHKLADLVPSLSYCNYSDLIKDLKLSDRLFPSDFFRTFNNIRQVCVKFEPDERVDLKLLTSFIEQATYIDELSLTNVGLSQSFYDSLNLLCPYLTRLTINEKPEHINSIEFMFDHHHLVVFGVNHEISFENILRAFAMASFTTLRFKLQGLDLEVGTVVPNKTYQMIVNHRTARFTNRTDMLEFLRDAYYSGLNYQEAKSDEPTKETGEKPTEEPTEQTDEKPKVIKEEPKVEEVNELKVKKLRRKSNRMRRIRI